MQVLQADWDPTFSTASFGFRPGRSCHQAVTKAQEHVAAGCGIVVDIDLEKFFDRVNHDVLMGLVAKRVSDRRILRLTRGFLTAGGLEGGLVAVKVEGTPAFLRACGTPAFFRACGTTWAAFAASVEPDAGRSRQGT